MVRRKILQFRRSADDHQNIDIERAFNELTVPILTYSPYISKAGHLVITAEKHIPLQATSADTKKSRRWWLRCLRRRDTIGEQERAVVIHDNTSLSSSEEGDDHGERLWPTIELSKMACFALVFNASNVLRFPYSCYHHGGLIFLLAYFALVTILIQPVIYLEMIVGQFSQSGVSGLSRFDIYSDGFTSVLSIMCLVFVPYNEIVLGFSGAYLLDSFEDTLGESENCEESWNHFNSCVPYNLLRNESLTTRNHTPINIWFQNDTVRTSLLSSELYFRQAVLEQTWHGGGYIYKLNMNIFLGLTITYVLVFIAIQGNLTSRIAQITICASSVVPISLTVLLVSQLMWPGAWDGIKYFLFDLKWEHLSGFEFWAEAIRHAFTSSGIGYGFYQRLSSRNPTQAANFYSTSWMICTLAVLFCTLSSLILFTELGIINHIFQATSYYEIFAEKTGISFISLSGALLKLGKGSMWPPICFFAIINCFGIWQQAVATEICTSMLIWAMPAKLKGYTGAVLRRILLLLVIAFQVLWAALLTHMWPYILDGFILFGGTWAASIIILAEVIVTIYVYGFNLLMIDVEITMQYSVPYIFRSQIKYVVPVAISMAVIVLTVDVCIEPAIRYLDIIKSPRWVTAIGIILNIIPVIAIVLVGISARRRRKVALSDKKTGPKVDDRGRTRKFDMAYHRLRTRREGIYVENIIEEYEKFRVKIQLVENLGFYASIDIKEVNLFEGSYSRGPIDPDNKMGGSKTILTKEKEVLKRRRVDQLELKRKLTKTMRRVSARANWQKLVNKTLLAEQKVNTVIRLIKYYIREVDRLKNIREANFLGILLEKFSLECVFLSATMEDHGKPAEENTQFLQRALASVPAKGMNNHYPPLTPFQTLIGKRIPSAEEERLAMIVRIKKQAKLPYKKDELTLKRTIRQAEEKSHEESIFFEDAPHEFFIETSDHVIIRIVVVKGADHSLLRSLPFPRPPEIRIPAFKIGGGTTTKTMHNIQAAVEQDIENKKPFARPPQGRRDIPRKRPVRYRPDALPAKATANESTYLYRPAKFPNWHFGAAVYPYGIRTENTYIVVLTNQFDANRNNKFRWLKKRKLRKVWPDYTVELNKQRRHTFGVTYRDLFRYDKAVADHDAAMNAPADIVYRREDGTDDNDSIGLNSSSSSTKSSKSSSSPSSSEHEMQRYYSPTLRFPVPEILITQDDDTDEVEIFRRRSNVSTVSSLDNIPKSMLNNEPGSRSVSANPVLGQDDRKKSSLRFDGKPAGGGKGSPVRFSQGSPLPRPKAERAGSTRANRQELPNIDRYSSGGRYSAYSQSRLSMDQHLSRMNLRRNASVIKSRHISNININKNIHHINQSEEEMQVKETMSLKAVYSQTSARGIQEEDSVRAINLRAGRLRRAMAHWNDYERYAYRSEGRTLTVEHIDEAQQRFVWAESGDSIASLVPEDDSDDYMGPPNNKRPKLRRAFLS